MRERFVILILVLVNLTIGYAQKVIKSDLDTAFCIPGILGVPRSKGLIIKRELLKDYRIKSKEISTGTITESYISRNRRWEFKVRAPVVREQNFIMALGLSYFVEEFQFENPTSLTLPFHQNLEDRSLKRLRGDLVIVKPTRGDIFYILRARGALNGDYTSEIFGGDKSDFLKFSIAPLIGWKRNDYLSYGVGAALSYNFGKRSIFPIFSYNKTFNQHWGIESILPAYAKLRYNTTDQKNYVYLSAELSGANFSLYLDSDQSDLIYLDKSEVRLLLIWEREIHDWLWVGVESGYRKNISFDLANSANIDSSIIIDNSLTDAFVVSFSLFIVPPRDYFD